MNNTHSLLIVLVIAVVTFLLRGAAFALFSKGNKIPDFINKLSKSLPYGIMGLLVVYCLKDTAVFVYPYGIPELLAVLSVVILQVWRKNSLLSVLASTLFYMLMVQLVF